MKTETNFKDWFNSFRKQKGLTINDLYPMLDVSRSTIGNYMSADREPSIDFLKKLEETFPELELNDLLRFVSDRKIKLAGLKKPVKQAVDPTYLTIHSHKEEVNSNILREKDEQIQKLTSENEELKKQVKQLIEIMASMNKQTGAA